MSRPHRIYAIARDLDVEPIDILELARSMCIPVKNQLSQIADSEAMALIEEWKKRSSEISSTNSTELKKLRARLAKALATIERQNADEIARLSAALQRHSLGPFVGSIKKKTFHRLSCKWAVCLFGSDSCIVFSDHAHATHSGYMPCKTCRS